MYAARVDVRAPQSKQEIDRTTDIVSQAMVMVMVIASRLDMESRYRLLEMGCRLCTS